MALRTTRRPSSVDPLVAPAAADDLEIVPDQERRRRPVDPGPRRSGRSRGIVGLVIGIVLTAAVAALIAQNPDATPIHWLSFDASPPLWVILSATFAAGAVVGVTLVGLLARSAERRARRL